MGPFHPSELYEDNKWVPSVGLRAHLVFPTPLITGFSSTVMGAGGNGFGRFRLSIWV